MLTGIVVLLGIGAVVTQTFRFKHLARRFGIWQGPSCLSPLIDKDQAHQAQQLSGLIQAAIQVAPWQTNCLAQAWVCALCLRALSIPYVVCLSAHTQSDRLEAHAWVVAGRRVLVGGHATNWCQVVGSWVFWGDD